MCARIMPIYAKKIENKMALKKYFFLNNDTLLHIPHLHMWLEASFVQHIRTGIQAGIVELKSDVNEQKEPF